MPVTVIDGINVQVRTPKLQADFAGPKLIRLGGPDGQVLLERSPDAGPGGLELEFADGKPAPLGVGSYANTRAVSVSRTVAHVHVEDIEGDACLRISTDPAGRLRVEPSAQTIRAGLGQVRLNLAGVSPALKLVAPLFQGCRQALTDPLVAGTSSDWPATWEAPLAILQGADGGWSVCCHDRLSLPKALRVGHDEDASTLGFCTEALGPWDGNVAVGSIAWIIDTHAGGWEVAARAYRAWLDEAFGLTALHGRRPDWADQIRLTLQWCPCRQDILDAVAGVIEPKHVLLHVPGWRSDPYDVNYPTYQASDEGAGFVAEALQRGFRVLPHFNYFAVDPNHPIFPRVQPFVMREVRSKRLMGWRWSRGSGLPFPQAEGKIRRLRDEKAMAYVHCGSSTWRRELVARVAEAARTLRVPGVFVDQTLCTYNPDHSLAENLTSTEGMLWLTRELGDLDGGLAVAGEGRNEMSMQYETFAQAHLFRSWHSNCEDFAGLDPVPVGEVLYGDLCRTMGYTALAGDTPAGALRLDVHEKLGALPSLTVRDGEQVTRPTPAVRRVLDRATSSV